jgi:putative endonuclease
MSRNQKIGQWGEALAADYLIEHGYEIIAHNIRTPFGEIDIIAKQEDIIIFVEVKTRTSHKMGLPEEAITMRKQEHMLACAQHYSAENGINHWQIDVLSVEGRPGVEPLITHFENVQ